MYTYTQSSQMDIITCRVLFMGEESDPRTIVWMISGNEEGGARIHAVFSLLQYLFLRGSEALPLPPAQ